jgi:hypothetical protein
VLVRRAKLHADEAAAIAAVSERLSGKLNLGNARSLSGRCIGCALVQPCIAEDVADTLVASLDHEISRAYGRFKLLLQRDKVMFIAARCLGLTAPQLLALEPSRFEGLNWRDFSFWERIDTADRAADMLSWYFHRLRPELRRGLGKQALFTALNGASLKLNAVGGRFNRAVQNAQLVRSIPSWSHWTRHELQR